MALARPDAPGHEIYMRDGATLNLEHRAWSAVAPEVTKADELKKLPKEEAKARALTAWMCANFWDIRAFGAVIATGVNAGQVRGPVQLTFATSVEPVLPLEISITRLAATTEKDADEKGGRTMGRKHIVPYRCPAPTASSPPRLPPTRPRAPDFPMPTWNCFEALGNMFEHDRSAARGEMATRRLAVFRHASALGNARAQDLFDRVVVARVHQGERHPVGDPRTDNWPVARSFADYAIEVDRAGLPEGIEVIER